MKLPKTLVTATTTEELLSVPGKVFTRILLNRTRGKADPILRDQQVGLRKGKSCTDQISILQIILK